MARVIPGPGFSCPRDFPTRVGMALTCLLQPRIAGMYLTNVERLHLGLEGTPDPSQAVVAAAVAKTGYKGYVAPDYVAAAPKPVPAPAGK